MSIEGRLNEELGESLADFIDDEREQYPPTEGPEAEVIDRDFDLLEQIKRDALEVTLELMERRVRRHREEGWEQAARAVEKEIEILKAKEMGR